MIGVIADDTTGANDIGVMFAKQGWATAVVAHDAPAPLPAADALVLDTDSRLDPPERAYAKVHAATTRLRALGCTWLHKKTCSVFRGNIGAEFDAMLDASGGDFAVVSLAYPKNGRQTRGGVHTVYGVPLEESAFARDPAHPLRESNLVRILQAQTRRRVGQVELGTVRAGAAALRIALAARRRECAYCIVDAMEQSDLAVLAEAAHDWPWHAGSAALAEELPRFWPRPEPRELVGRVAFSGSPGVLVVSGSLTPQTRAQTAALRATGTATVTLDSRRVFTAALRAQEIDRVTAEALGPLRAGADALVLAEQTDDVVAATKMEGTERGLNALGTSKAVSAALAEITERIIDGAAIKRLVVAGGDTSGTICRRLGIQGNWVLEEVATGVPSGLAIGRPLLLVLKSGSFGDADFLRTAIARLKQTFPYEPPRPG
jgi:uncharacterized protein YgbK (DUF1537 family)